MKRFIFVVLVSFALIGMASAASEWVGPGGTDYNDDGDWSDTTAWSAPVPVSSFHTAVLEATDFSGVNAVPNNDPTEVGTDVHGARTITLDVPADIAALEAPLSIHGNSSGYHYESSPEVIWFWDMYNVLLLEADLTVGTLALDDTNFSITMTTGTTMTVDGSGDQYLCKISGEFVTLGVAETQHCHSDSTCTEYWKANGPGPWTASHAKSWEYRASWGVPADPTTLGWPAYPAEWNGIVIGPGVAFDDLTENGTMDWGADGVVWADFSCPYCGRPKFLFWWGCGHTWCGPTSAPGTEFWNNYVPPIVLSSGYDVVLDGPSQVQAAVSAFSDFDGNVQVGSVGNPCLLGGNYWVTISEDPMDLIPDLPGGNFLALGAYSTYTIADGSSICGRFVGRSSSDGSMLDVSGKIILEGEGWDVDNADADDDFTTGGDGALVYVMEGYNTPCTTPVGVTGTTTLDLQADTEIGVMVTPNLVLAIVGNTVAPPGEPGATLTKSGVGVLRFAGDVGIDCANRIDLVIEEGKVDLYPTCTLYGNITVNDGATLIASPAQILCGMVTVLPGGAWSLSGVWDGGGDAISYHDPLNWLDDVVPGAADSVSIPGVVAAPIIEVDTPGFPAPGTTVCDRLVMTAACTLQVDADLTTQHCDTRSGTLDLVAPATYTIAQVAIEHAYVRAITGDGTLFKTGIAHTFDARNGQHTEAGFTGEIIVDEGLFGPHSWANGSGGYDSSAYFPNATITIQNDGMATTKATDWATELWGELRLNGQGMGGLLVDAHDGMATLGNGNDWLIKRGAFKRFIEHGNARVGPYANPVTLLSTSGFVCAHTWGWAPGSGQDTELSGLVSGTGTLVKMGDSALILSGSVENVAADAVEVRESCLVVNGDITVGDVTVDTPTPYAGSGKHWAWTQSAYDGATYKQFQPNLGGSGVIHNTLKVLDGGWLFPLKSMPDPTYTVFPSNLTVGDADIDEATWEVGIIAYGGVGTPGTDWDFLTATAAGTSGAGTLDLATTTFRPKSTLADPGANDTWQIAVADSAITGAGTCVAIGDDWPNAVGGAFTVRTANGDTELWLDYTFGEAPPELEGDVTGDCKVNILDMIAIRNHLNVPLSGAPDDCSADPNSIYDVTGDCKINILDMILVRNHLNTVCE